MKSTIIILFVILSIGSGYSQRLSFRHQKSINSYYTAINQYVGQMEWMLKCLTEYYGDADRFKKKKSWGNLRCKCASSQKMIYYMKAKAGSKSLPTTIAKSLNPMLDSLNSTYNAVVEKNRELEIYIRLEDHKNDNLKQSDELLTKIEELYRQFNRQQKQFDRIVQRIYSKQSQKGTPLQAYKQMAETMEKAENLLDLWQYNMDSNTPTQSLPYTEIVTYVNYLDSLSTAPDYSAQLSGQIKYNYKNLRLRLTNDVVKSLRYVLKKHTYKNRKTDGESNWAYSTLGNYYNNMMVGWLNRLVPLVQQAGYACAMSAKYSPVFRLRSQPKLYSLISAPYELMKIPVIHPQAKSTDISKATVKALNNYIEFVNREVKIHSHIYRNLTAFNHSMNTFLASAERKYGPSYSYYSASDFPYDKFHKALYNSKFIPQESQTALNNRLQTILNITAEREALELELAKYSKKKKYKEDNFEKGKEILKRFEQILNDYELHINALLTDLKKVYEAYKINDATNNWRISGEALTELTDNSFHVLQEVKTVCKDSSSIKPNTRIVHKLVRKVISNQYSNMNGIYKLGRNNGHCPYTPYEDLPESAEHLADNADAVDSLLHDKKRRRYKKRNDFYKDHVYVYNSMVDDLNKFAWLALGETEIGRREISKPVFLLYRMRQPLYFDYKEIQVTSQPQKPHVTSSTPESEEMKGYAYNNLVLLLDVSSSMKAPEKFPLLKESFLELLKILRNQDEVAIVSYSGKAQIVMKPISCSLKDSIASIINSMKTGGGTDARKGLKLAYKSASRNFIENGNNRIILATDGQFKLSDKDYRLVEKYAEQGIHLTLFYFGTESKELPSLKRLTNTGNGNYVLINKGNMILKLKEEVKAIKVK